jgi:hypothetical protein
VYLRNVMEELLKAEPGINCQQRLFYNSRNPYHKGMGYSHNLYHFPTAR